MQPIPENLGLYQTCFADAPMNKKNQTALLGRVAPDTDLAGYPAAGYLVIFLPDIFFQRIYLYLVLTILLTELIYIKDILSMK